MPLESSTEKVLRQTSRTFYFPIVRLPPLLREAVTSAYLSLRAIDEIEDHPRMEKATKVALLRKLGRDFHYSRTRLTRFSGSLRAYRDILPEVTNRLDDWMELAPRPIAHRILDVSGHMAQHMAYWVENDWRIRSGADLDQYTFGVAGTVGELLSDLWCWHDGTQSHRSDAIRFGCGLQAVNILRNRTEDLTRGVDFFPEGWNESNLASYARAHLSRANIYVGALPGGAIKDFCHLPLALAYATLAAIERGEPKLNRAVVLEMIEQHQQGPSSRTVSKIGKPPTKNRSSHKNVLTRFQERRETLGSSPHRSGHEVTNHDAGCERVILVNWKDEVIGTEEKIKTHVMGALHRAFSIFIFNSRGQLLIQKRTTTKYHSKGLWSNTCCGHPRLGESTNNASRRRLREEMGFDCELEEMFEFVYRAELENGLTEHEYDHVLVGKFSGTPNPSKEEVEDWKWMDLTTLKLEILRHPEKHTYWFRIALAMLNRLRFA
jgi:farnesyl-diphosphate farnesyltransferase